MAIVKTESKDQYQIIHRRFDESVAEVRQLLMQKKELIPHPPREDVGSPIESFTAGYAETVAEIHRLELIKTLSARFK